VRKNVAGALARERIGAARMVFCDASMTALSLSILSLLAYLAAAHAQWNRGGRPAWLAPLGLLLHFGVTALGSTARFRRSRQLLAFAAVPIAASLVLWLPRLALVSGAVVLLGLALSNPDAWIARHNVDRYQETGKVDWVYLQGLSDDAVPELVGLPPQDRSCALAGRETKHDDPVEWNLGRSRARSALEGVDTAPVSKQSCD